MASGVASAAFTKVASFTGNPFARHGGGEVPHISTNSRILGTIFGNCAGDAIGLLTEFLVKEDAIKMYGEAAKRGIEYKDKIADMHRARWRHGDWTDDSDQMILIMLSITENKGEVDQKDIAKRFLNWARHGFSELGDEGGMGIGATTSYVLKHKDFETNPHYAARFVWEQTGRDVAANGAVMRTSILGVHHYDDIHKVIANTLDVCEITHADPRCQAACVAVTTAIALMLQRRDGFEVDQIIDESFEHATKLLNKSQREEFKKHMYAKKLKDLKLDEKGKIGYALKCMGSGFWALRQNDFRDALTELIMEGGDADTNGAVAGAMLGCKLGVEGIPASWLEEMPHRKWLQEHVDNFMTLSDDVS